MISSELVAKGQDHENDAKGRDGRRRSKQTYEAKEWHNSDQLTGVAVGTLSPSNSTSTARSDLGWVYRLTGLTDRAGQANAVLCCTGTRPALPFLRFGLCNSLSRYLSSLALLLIIVIT